MKFLVYYFILLTTAITSSLALSSSSSSAHSLFELFLFQNQTNYDDVFLKEFQLNLLKNRNNNCINGYSSNNNNNLSVNLNEFYELLNKFSISNQNQNDNATNLLINYLNKTCFDYDILKNLTRNTTNLLIDLIWLQSVNKACDFCTNVEEEIRIKKFDVWLYSLIFVSIINLSSLVGAVVIPCTNKEYYKRVLMFLISLAVGSLAGSGLLHLIPQAYNIAEDPRYAANHEYLWKSVTMMSGIYLFYLVERVMKILVSIKRKTNKSKKLRKQMSMLNTLENLGYAKQNEPAVDLSVEMRTKILNKSEDLNEDDDSSIGLQHNNNHGHSHFVKNHNHSNRSIDELNHIAPVAWMIIFGDGLHNFIDGLSIGAAFSESILKGVSISIAVICEEFPHELGDFAILINAGMTYKQALLFNGLSALCCYAGLVFGILVGQNVYANQWIYAVAGGMFLYISLCDMVPELTETGDELEKSHFKALKQEQATQPTTNKINNIETKRILFKFKILIIQNFGILLGFGVMLLMALYAKNIEL